MSTMEAIANARANTKAKAEQTNIRITPKATAASDHCADLGAYNKRRRSKGKEIHSGCQKAGASRQDDVSQAKSEYCR